MASVNWEKFKSPQEVKAMFRHCDLEERKKTNHTNKQINKKLTGKNFQYNLNYKSTCEKYDNRIAALDNSPNANKRHDRVTCFGLEIPYPEDLNPKDDLAWANSVNNILKKFCGAENIMNLYVHVDEQHTYMDAATKQERESRKHIHAFVVPVMDDKLNGKKFSGKSRMVKLNNLIHEMSMKDFKVDFMNGSKKKSKESVETLKNKSRMLEAEEDIRKREIEAQSKIAVDEEIFKIECKKRKTDLDNRQHDLDEREQMLIERENNLAQREDNAAQLEYTLQQWRQQLLNGLEKSRELDKQYKDLIKTISKVRQNELKGTYDTIDRLRRSAALDGSIPEDQHNKYFDV